MPPLPHRSFTQDSCGLSRVGGALPDTEVVVVREDKYAKRSGREGGESEYAKFWGGAPQKYFVSRLLVVDVWCVLFWDHAR